ncbi:MAG: sulfatase-like hydrolase/transferase [Sandaracinaceae bacterium]
MNDLTTTERPADASPLPRLGYRRALVLGYGSWILGGLGLAFLEGTYVVLTSHGRVSWGLLFAAGLMYALSGFLWGLLAGPAALGVTRLLRLDVRREDLFFGALGGVLVTGGAFAVATYRIRRDLYAEQLAWASVEGVLVAGGCLLFAVLAGASTFVVFRRWYVGRRGRFLDRWWGAPVFAWVTLLTLWSVVQLAGQPAEAARGRHDHPAPPNAPNVLFVVVDTLRADRLPAWGYEHSSTPHLDRFGEDAVRFENAFANASWTRPSFTTLLTGRFASSHGVMLKTDALADELTTLPEVLSENGYATAGIVANYNVSDYFNFDQGFDHYHYHRPDFVIGSGDDGVSGVRLGTEQIGAVLATDVFPVIEMLMMRAYRETFQVFRTASDTVLHGTVYHDAPRMNEDVLGWLAEAPADPFFLLIGYMDPHDPFYEHPYTGFAYSRSAHPEPTTADIPTMERLYAGEITFWDEHFGVLMDELRRRGLYDDMLIVVVSDHGEEFGEHGGFWHGTSLYDEQVHVPLYVKLPGNRQAGTAVRHWVQLADVMPTVLDELGLDAPEGVQGGSLWEGTDRVFAEEDHEGHVLSSLREVRDMEERKVITAGGGNERGLPPVELFRVDEDPGEQRNLAGEEPELVGEQLGRLEAVRDEAQEGAVTARPVALDPSSVERLCELGYLEGPRCDR